jgi:branched-chain amino acid transport system substrate-binding protein
LTRKHGAFRRHPTSIRQDYISPDYQYSETDFKVVTTMQSKTKKLLAALIAAGIVPAAHAADIKIGVAEALSGGAAQ